MPGANAPEERITRELDRLDRSDIPEDDSDAIRATINDLNDYNRDSTNPSKSTKAGYCKNLRLLSEYAMSEEHGPLTLMAPDGLNAVMRARVDDADWSDTTVAQYQSALKALGAYLGYDREAIDIDSTQRSSGQVDPRTVLTPEQFHAIRENAVNMRDRAIIDFLGYTGQRVRVIQTLRIRDIDIEEGVWFMPDADGLRGAEKIGKKRPLLGARKSIQEWIQMHPTGGHSDHLITAMPHGPSGDVGDEISRQTIARRIELAAERADDDIINTDETPVNPHALRHFFVTVAKEQYDMDDSTVKFLIGHGEGSNVMATTYRHLSDEYHVETAMEDFGLDTEDDDTGFAPPVCPTCGTPLRPDAEACPTPACGEVFVPGADAGTATTGYAGTGVPKETFKEAVKESMQASFSALGEMPQEQRNAVLDDPDRTAHLDEAIDRFAEKAVENMGND